MKKTVCVILFIIAAIAVASVIAIIESNKKTPIARYTETIQTSNTSVDDAQSDSASARVLKDLAVFNNSHTVKYEFLSYEIVDDININDHTEYNGEFFIEGKIPDSNSLVDYVDYQKMREDYPDVDEYIKSNGNSGMTAVEYQKFLEQHLSEYTISKHPKTKYVFVHCRLTNISQDSVDEYINALSIVGVRNSLIVGAGEFSSYFDASQHIEGEDRIHNYFRYTFHKSGESIECVIGCELREEFFDFSEGVQYFIGFLPIGLESYDQLDPSIDKGFVALN